MAWKDYAYTFYTQTNSINDLEFLQLLCNDFSWHLYAEENRKGANYMISEKTFVIDIFYERDEEGSPSEEVEDTQSMGSSVIQIGKERVESVYRAIKKVDISLIEEEWSFYFRICTFSVMFHLKNRDYYNIYRLMRNLQKYDTEEEDGFGQIIRRLKDISERTGKRVEYSFLTDRPVVYHEIDTDSTLYKSLGLFSYVEGDQYRIYNRRIESVSEIEEVQNELYVSLLIEMMVYNIEVELTGTVIIPARIDGRECTVEVAADGYVLVDGEVDEYRTLLLKRTESMYHVIRETEVEVNYCRE